MGDTPVYGWTPLGELAGSSATISDPTAARPTFVPNVRARSGSPSPTASSRSETDHHRRGDARRDQHRARGRSRSYRMHASRNVLQALSAQVSDADLDPLTCTKVSSPGHPEEIRRGPEACPGIGHDHAGSATWTATLVVTDGVNTTTTGGVATCASTIRPVAALIPPRAGNVGGGPVSLLATARDVNGDPRSSTRGRSTRCRRGSALAATALPATAGVSLSRISPGSTSCGCASAIAPAVLESRRRAGGPPVIPLPTWRPRRTRRPRTSSYAGRIPVTRPRRVTIFYPATGAWWRRPSSPASHLYRHQRRRG